MKFKGLFKQSQSDRIQLADTELELHKHFRLVRKLGRGSFATVYEAERLSDGQRYALKVTELNALSQLDKVAVVEEIRLLASLNHPNIIAYYEAFCDHDKLCVVTEIVQGGDLGTFIRKMADDEDFLWERQIWNLFLQAALGVQYLHRNHVLHRDLKPQNIMMTDKKGQGLLKIADLGVSAELARVFTNVQIGTPHYMAPEMWNRKAYSYSADVWALGCILHELCTLRPTFLSSRERTEEDIKQRVLRGSYEPIHTRYSLDLRKLVDVMLQRDPAKRPTIDEIMQMPEVRSKLQYLPLELQRVADEQQRPDDPIKLEQALGQLPDDLHSINCLLPPARYATGSGVAELLCGMPKRRSFSLSDLQAAAERQRLGAGQAAAAAGAAGQQRRVQLAAADSMERAASSSVPAIGGDGGGDDGRFAGGERVHKSRSMGRLDGEEAERRLRRRSIMVGELLFRLQQEQEKQATAAAGAAGGEGEAGQGATSPELQGSEAPWQRLSHDAADLVPSSMRRRSLTPPGREQHGRATRASPPPRSVPEGQPLEISLHGGMAYLPGEEASTGAAAAGSSTEEEARGRGLGTSSMLRRSVAVAEVLYHHEVTQAQRRGHLDDLPKSAAPLEPFEFCETSSGNGRKQQAKPAAPPPQQPTAGPLPAAPRSALLAQLAAGAGRPANTASTPLPPGTPPAGSGVGSPYAPSAAQQQQQQQQQQPKQAEEAKPEKKKKKHGRLWRLMYGEHEGNGMHQPLW